MIADSHQHEQFDHVLAEHRHLRRLIQRLRNLLFEQQESGFVVGGLLDELRDDLVTHFAHEEKGGYFDEVVTVAPRLKTRVDSLLSQHPQLMLTIDELRDSVEEGEIPEGAWPTLTKSFEQFVVDFVQHEEHENQLLQEAYFRDETAGD